MTDLRKARLLRVALARFGPIAGLIIFSITVAIDEGLPEAIHGGEIPNS